MGSKPKTPQVPAVDIAGDIQKYVSGLQGQLPTILASEAQYRPQFQGLNLADIQSFLGGTEQQQGLFGLSALASQQTQEQLQQARAAELAGMQAQAPAVRTLMQTLSPEAAQQVANAQVIAQQAQRRAEQRQLSPQEARMATQTAREASGQRGMLGSIGSVASEVLNRDMYREQVQQAAGRKRLSLERRHTILVSNSTRHQVLGLCHPLRCPIRQVSNSLVWHWAQSARELHSFTTLEAHST